MKKLSWKVLAPLGIFGAATLIIGAFIFQPWKLFIDTEIQETLPTTQKTEQSNTDSPETEPSSNESVVLAEGSLISHEYQTSGTVKILQLADGSRVLRLENLDTSDGPRVEVWLTDAPVIAGQGGWRVFDDGRYQSLGLLKGNQGSQNYEIPADLDLSDFSSVSLWCVTFSVSFGAAQLVASQT